MGKHDERTLHNGREDGARRACNLRYLRARPRCIPTTRCDRAAPDHDRPFLPVLDRHRRQIDGKVADPVGWPPMPSMCLVCRQWHGNGGHTTKSQAFHQIDTTGRQDGRKKTEKRREMENIANEPTDGGQDRRKKTKEVVGDNVTNEQQGRPPRNGTPMPRKKCQRVPFFPLPEKLINPSSAGNSRRRNTRMALKCLVKSANACHCFSLPKNS